MSSSNTAPVHASAHPEAESCKSDSQRLAYNFLSLNTVDTRKSIKGIKRLICVE